MSRHGSRFVSGTSPHPPDDLSPTKTPEWGAGIVSFSAAASNVVSSDSSDGSVHGFAKLRIGTSLGETASVNNALAHRVSASFSSSGAAGSDRSSLEGSHADHLSDDFHHHRSSQSAMFGDDDDDESPHDLLGMRAKAQQGFTGDGVQAMNGAVLPENNGALPRMGHIAVAYEQTVYVFGGVNAKGQFSAHIFCHEKRDLLWRDLRGVGVVPRGRVSHTAALVGSKIYIHGGHRQLEVLDDFFAYDITTTRWEKIHHESADGPGGIFLHSMVHIPTSDALFVVGGVHHREQNRHLGHLFDLRNRVWSGIPPPPQINPQHLQFVTLAYHEPGDVVVVIGLVEENVMMDNFVAMPFVYTFQPESFAWKRVQTPTSPESPLSFRMETVWEPLLHLLVTSGGGVYDSVTETWLFPFPLSNSGISVEGTATSAAGENVGNVPPPPPPAKLGFLMLNVKDMSWSMVQCRFRRRLLAEIAAFNAVEQTKLERSAAVGKIRGATATVFSPPSRVTGPAAARAGGGAALPSPSAFSHSSSAAASAPGGVVGSVFGQQASRRVPHGPSLSPPSHGRGDASSRSPLMNRDSTRNSIFSQRGSDMSGSAAAVTTDSYRRLVNFDNVPEFTRKFVLVAVREPRGKDGKLRPMQHLVLHGGLAEATDYTMLMFTLTMARANELGLGKKKGALAGFVRSASFRNLRGSRGSIRPLMDPEDSMKTSEPTAHFEDVFQRGRLGSRVGGANRLSPLHGSPTSPSSLRVRPSFAAVDVGIRFGTPENQDDIDEDARRTPFQRHPLLLPVLPSGRTPENRPRFALQYTAQNGVHSTTLLPYANIPVAVMQTPQEMQKWSKQYYGDQRRWLAERMRSALVEDKKLRRLRRVTKSRLPRAAVAAAAAASAAAADGKLASAHRASEDVSDDEDNDPLMESLYLLETLPGVPRNEKTGDVKATAVQSLEDELTAEPGPIMEDSTDDKLAGRVKDFFEEKRLELFPSEGELLLLAQQSAEAPEDENLSASNTPAEHAGSKGKAEKNKLAIAATAAGKLVQVRKVATVMNDSKTSADNSGAAASFSEGGPSMDPLSALPPSSLFAQSTSHKGHNTGISFERLHMRVKRHGANTGFHRAAGTALGATAGDDRLLSVGGSVARTLLGNGLERFRSEDDSAETREKKALLRWRFLRALVCTGEASHLVFLASQEPAKMKGVPVSSTPGLLLSPELHFIGPSQAYRVPVKPVPYHIADATKTNTFGVAPATSSPSAARFSQVTSSGMVVYNLFR